MDIQFPEVITFPKKDTVTLDQVEVNKKYFVDKIPENITALLEYFVENKFLPGSEIYIKDFSDSRGVITISLGGNEVFFSMEVAQLIWVYPN